MRIFIVTSSSKEYPTNNKNMTRNILQRIQRMLSGVVTYCLLKYVTDGKIDGTSDRKTRRTT